MKYASILLLIICISFCTVESIQAQTTENQNALNTLDRISVGGGLMYGSEVEKLGLRLDGVYIINEKFRGEIDLGFYFPDKEDYPTIGEVKTTWTEVNINGNYIFYTDTDMGLQAYAIAGLNILRYKIKVGGASDSDSKAGLNIGAGGEYKLDFANLFTEIRYVLGDADQLNITAGLRFPLNKF